MKVRGSKTEGGAKTEAGEEGMEEGCAYDATL